MFLLSALVASLCYFKLEFVDDLFDDQESVVMKVRRVIGMIFAAVCLFFLASVFILCYVQTGNLLMGQTTCERFGGSSKKQPLLTKD
jgi:hypothetical protein